MMKTAAKHVAFGNSDYLIYIQSKEVNRTQRAVCNESVQVSPAFHSNRILVNPPPRARVVIESVLDVSWRSAQCF